MNDMNEPLEHTGPPITELTRGQRRVLGTLLEKALTTPESYPLTLKALTTGCNQKSNRHPITEFSEDDVLAIADELRQLGLLAVVHTESGRTERYRHYVRKRFTLTEPQVAVLTELLLRGRQTVGDLRARASRMVPIDSLETLRDALRGLIEQKYVQATGPLERRGVEVDHGFYAAGENKKLAWDNSAAAHDDGPSDARESSSRDAEPSRGHNVPRPASVPSEQALGGSSSALRQLEDQNRELRDRLDAVEEELRRLKGVVEDLVRDLRG